METDLKILHLVAIMKCDRNEWKTEAVSIKTATQFLKQLAAL